MMIPRPRRLTGALAVLGLLVAAGCGGTEDATPGTGGEPATPTGSEPQISGDVVVFAAASLTDTFTELGEAFEQQHPDGTVTFSFGPSSGLAQQVVSGAPADLFAAASPATMQTVVEAGGNAGEPEVFVQNTLQIAVPPGNPGQVSGLADFADPDLTIALCAPEVPCGAAAEQVFEVAGITPEPDSLETDVRAALSKVQLDEVDAALVYRTDVVVAGDGVEGIDFPESTQVVNDYLVSVLTEAPNPDGAQAFLELVQSAEGQQVLADAGFDSD